MRTCVLVIGLALVLTTRAAAGGGGEPKVSADDVRKAERDLRQELRGPLMVYIIDTPREPFLRAVEFDRIVLFAGRPFYRFRSAGGGAAYWILDPSRIFAFTAEGAPTARSAEEVNC